MYRLTTTTLRNGNGRTPAAALRRTPLPRRLSRPLSPVADPLQSPFALESLFVRARDALVVEELASGRIVRWNRAAERLFGYSAAQAIGQPVEMLMPEAVGLLHRERIAQYLRSGETDVLNGRGPLGLPALTSSGEELRVELSLAPLRAPGDAAQWMLLCFRDASMEKQLELRALDAARAEAARAETETRLRRSEQLLRDSTRELATPVAYARRAAARLTRMAAEDGEPRPRRLALLAQVVEGRTDAVLRRLEQIADSAAIDSGTLALDIQRVNLVPLVSRIVSTARARGSVHRFNFSAPQGLTVPCDARRIEAVVHELIERAMRQNPRGCWIDVDLRRPLAGVARIEVRDYGQPISPRQRGRLAKLAEADPGWKVNQYVIERHGGTLETEFLPDGGTRGVLSLPTHAARVAPAM